MNEAQLSYYTKMAFGELVWNGNEIVFKDEPNIGVAGIGSNIPDHLAQVLVERFNQVERTLPPEETVHVKMVYYREARKCIEKCELRPRVEIIVPSMGLEIWFGHIEDMITYLQKEVRPLYEEEHPVKRTRFQNLKRFLGIGIG